MMRYFLALILTTFVPQVMAAVTDITPCQITSAPAVHYGGTTAKAVVDTIVLMGPRGIYPYRGDFESAWGRPGGAGLLTDGWTSVDQSSTPSRWHVDTFNNPGTGRGAWCGDLALPSCGDDPAGGYGNEWREILEFRKSVSGAATVRVQATLRYDTEPGYDYVLLQRRTPLYPNFESIYGGQGASWNGRGDALVDVTLSYTAAELLGGTDIAVAFVFDSDNVWSDQDCLWPTAGPAIVDDITVTVNDGSMNVYTEDFEDDGLGPDWQATSSPVVGDFARVWSHLGDADLCRDNTSNQVAFIDDGRVVPGTYGTVGRPGNDYGVPGGYIVNNRGGLAGYMYRLDNAVYSPVIALPGGTVSGLTISFDVFVHEMLVLNDSPGIFYVWSVRSTAGGDLSAATWRDRGFFYAGGPAYERSIQEVGDLLEPGATSVQIRLGAVESGAVFGFGSGTNGTPAPYFDNVRVQAYAPGSAQIAVTESRLANDGFPATGTLNLANLGANSVRFDMASNIAPPWHQRNDPGDSICVEFAPRNGGTLDAPLMHWTFARRNPLFDPYRTLPASPVTGVRIFPAKDILTQNRYSFDLPDTGLLFPGDVLQYYFAATDHVGGDTKVVTAPADLTGYGDPTPLAYPGLYTVRCLPSLRDAAGTRPPVLFWNDFGFGDGQVEWFGALRVVCGEEGLDYDLYTTHAPTSGVGNGLGGRATGAQIAGYTDMLYAAGDVGWPTLSNGDFQRDPGNDIVRVGNWLSAGGRDLFMTGNDLAHNLSVSSAAGRSFLEFRMGLTCSDQDVRDNIDGQVAPLVVSVAGNPVFTTAAEWTAYGGCPGIEDFDNVTPFGGATRLAQFTAPGGTSTPYPFSAATLKFSNGSRVVSLNHDLAFITDPAKAPAPLPARAVVLSNVLDYFGLPGNGGPVGDVPGSRPPLVVTSYPNPFNPSLVIRYSLPVPGHLAMKIFDARGALVRTLVDGPVPEAGGVVTWDGADQSGAGVSSGLYFVETRADGRVDVRKVTMIR